MTIVLLSAQSDKFPKITAFQTKEAEKCPETACITNNGSNFGQRQQQSSENCLLFSFALNLRPPTFVSINFETQVGFKFAQRIWSGQTPSRGPPALFS